MKHKKTTTFFLWDQFDGVELDDVLVQLIRKSTRGFGFIKGLS